MKETLQLRLWMGKKWNLASGRIQLVPDSKFLVSGRSGWLLAKVSGIQPDLILILIFGIRSEPVNQLFSISCRISGGITWPIRSSGIKYVLKLINFKDQRINDFGKFASMGEFSSFQVEKWQVKIILNLFFGLVNNDSNCANMHKKLSFHELRSVSSGEIERDTSK